MPTNNALHAAKVILYPFRSLIDEQQLSDAAEVIDEAMAEPESVEAPKATAPVESEPTIQELLECKNPVYLELRQIYCCKGAEFTRPNLQRAWKEIARLEWLLSRHMGTAPLPSAPEEE